MPDTDVGFTRLHPRSEDDLMQLYGQVRLELKARFKAHHIETLPGQMAELESALEAALKAASGEVTMVAVV